MLTTRTCRHCGAEINGEAPFGHCPGCLIKLGFGPIPEAANAGTSEPGKTRLFGEYELLEQIGRGGMGVVYKAQQVALNRRVALKMILAGELASPASVERFQIEAEAAANLHHPNIVPIYEIGEHSGSHYFSMKLVEGESLAKTMAEFALPQPDAAPTSKIVLRQAHSQIARLIATMARAVHYAHEHGILHRDLKPSNILIDTDGTPYLTDFGLAKITSRGDSVTETGDIVGSINYMAPEQAKGLKVSAAADIYSLGAILYELLTTKPPFRAQTPTETLRLVAEQEPTSPRIENRLIDPDLATICLKCLEKNPQQRYASAAELADDLDRWQRFEPIRARRATVLTRLHRWTRRNRVGTALILTLLVGLGVTSCLLNVVVEQRVKNELAFDDVRRQKDENAELVHVTVGMLRRDLTGFWESTRARFLPMKSEQLAALLPRPIERITNHATLVRLKVGLAAHESPVDESGRYAKLFAYLEREMSQRMGCEVRLDLNLYKFEGERFNAVKKGELDILRAGAYPVFELLEGNLPIQPLVEQFNPGKLAVFFTRTNTGITSLQDLKGRSMAFGETNATISFVARSMLAKAGITGRDLSRYGFLDSATEFAEDVAEGGMITKIEQIGQLTSHSEVLEQVIDGKFDAGVSNFKAFERQQRYGLVMIPGTQFDNLRNVWIGRAGLPQRTAQAFVGAMTALRDQGILLTLPDAPTQGYRAITKETHAADLETMRRIEGLFPRNSP